MKPYNDEAVIRLGEACIEAMTEEYLTKHSDTDLESYRNVLRHTLKTHWLRSAIDSEEVIGCMERVRKEKLRTDESYKNQFIED